MLMELGPCYPESEKKFRFTTPEIDGVSAVVEVLFRRSRVQRRPRVEDRPPKYDFDIVTIEITPARRGFGAAFFKSLVAAAESLGRGVFLEQTITAASRQWAAKLIRDGVLQAYVLKGGYTVEDNYLSLDK